MAPYWSDILSGRISYEMHTTVDVTLIEAVSKYIRHQESNDFAGTWMLVSEWKNVQKGII